MPRPGVTEKRKFLNVLISSDVIRLAKAAAASAGKNLNDYVEAKLICAGTQVPHKDAGKGKGRK
jgi:predicted HicB family RNase H-like nuclease